MQKHTKKYYLLASVLILVLTWVVYRGIDALVFAKSHQIEKSQVYLASVREVPVLKSLLADASTPNQTPLQDILQQPELQFTNTLTAKSAYVVDVDTGTVLFDRNSERILLPASTTKLMTALVALDVYSLDDVVTVPKLPNIVGLKHDFIVGEQVTVASLLQAALIQSSNDAAYILALQSDLGLAGFVEAMNQKALHLQLKSTQYENPAGFDTDTQRSSARDLVVLSLEFMKHEFLRSVVATKEAVISDVSGEYSHYLYNTHQLLGIDPTVVGIKTGTTEGAAQVLITQFVRDGHTIIIVIMGSDDRYLETTQLINWVFDSYTWVSPDQLVQEK